MSNVIVAAPPVTWPARATPAPPGMNATADRTAAPMIEYRMHLIVVLL
jgi:hypothetical protein